MAIVLFVTMDGADRIANIDARRTVLAHVLKGLAIVFAVFQEGGVDIVIGNV
jgi:hypothetical protein